MLILTLKPALLSALQISLWTKAQEDVLVYVQAILHFMLISILKNVLWDVLSNWMSMLKKLRDNVWLIVLILLLLINKQGDANLSAWNSNKIISIFPELLEIVWLSVLYLYLQILF